MTLEILSQIKRDNGLWEFQAQFIVNGLKIPYTDTVPLMPTQSRLKRAILNKCFKRWREIQKENKSITTRHLTIGGLFKEDFT